MTIGSLGVEWFHADGRTDRQTWHSKWLIFSSLRTRLKTIHKHL